MSILYNFGKNSNITYKRVVALLYFGIIIAVALVVLLILFSSIKIKVKVLKDGSCEEIVLHVYALYGVIKYRIEIPFVEIFNKAHSIAATEINSDIEVSNKEAIKDQKRKDFSWEEIESIYNRMRDMYRKYKIGVQYINEKLVMDEISWNTEVGVYDAAATAITTGVFWAVKANIIALLINKMDLKNYYVNVYPLYGADKLNTSLDCIITLKVGYIIIAGFKILINKANR